MPVVTIRGLVFDVTCIDSDLPGLLFGGTVNILIRHRLRPTFLTQYLRDGLCQRRLAVIDVSDRPDVHMWLRPVKVHSKGPGRRKLKDVSLVTVGEGR